MKGKYLLTIFTFVSLLSVNTTIAYNEPNSQTVPEYTTYDDTRTFSNSVTIKSHLEASDSIIVYGDLNLLDYAKIDGDLIVYGNLTLGDYIDIGGNVKVTGNIKTGRSLVVSSGSISGKNIEVGDYAELVSVNSSGNLKIGDYVTIKTGVLSSGTFETGRSLELYGNSKVIGKTNIGEYSYIYGTLYVYNVLDTKDYTELLRDGKIKVTGDFFTGRSFDLNGRFYIYGTKTIGQYFNDYSKNYSGLMGEIDPLLKYTISIGETSEIKSKLDSYLAQKDYVNLFNYLENYIENETFDKNKFNSIKSRYLGNIGNNNSSLSETIPTTNATKYSPYLPENIKNLLDSKLNKIPNEYKITVYSKVIAQIDLLVARLEENSQTTTIVEKINLLLGIKSYMEKKINEESGYDVLKDLGF